MLPDRPIAPLRTHSSTIQACLRFTGQAKEAMLLQNQEISFAKLLEHISAGDSECVREEAQNSFLRESDLFEMASRYSTNPSSDGEELLNVLLDAPSLKITTHPGRLSIWHRTLCSKILNTLPSSRRTASPTELRLLWAGSKPQTLEHFLSVLYMGRTSALHALGHESLSCDQMDLYHQWLTFPECMNLHSYVNCHLDASRDLLEQGRKAEQKSLFLEVLGTTSLLDKTEYSGQNKESTIETIAIKYNKGSKREKDDSLKCLSIMLELWKHAAGEARISALMTDLVARGSIFKINRSELDLEILALFVEAGGRLSPSTLILDLCALIGGRKWIRISGNSLRVLGELQQKKVAAAFEAVTDIGGLGRFQSFDKDRFIEVFAGLAYNSPICNRIGAAIHKSEQIRRLQFLHNVVNEIKTDPTSQNPSRFI